MKIILKLLLAPVRLAIWLLVHLFALVTYISSFALGIISTLLSILAVLVLLTTSIQNGVILLALAFLISPLGLPMLTVKLMTGLAKSGVWLGERTN